MSSDVYADKEEVGGLFSSLRPVCCCCCIFSDVVNRAAGVSHCCWRCCCFSMDSLFVLQVRVDSVAITCCGVEENAFAASKHENRTTNDSVAKQWSMILTVGNIAMEFRVEVVVVYAVY